MDAWLARAAKGASPEVLGRLFEAAFGALRARTNITLSEVTLTAIAGRVLHHAAGKFPLFKAVELDPNCGIQCRELREGITSVHASELREAIRFVLVEYLTVLGNLTAEILTPELHAELSGVAMPKALRVAKGRRAR